MKKGFTLIELSIVLVIIGLIVGGVLVGRDLIRAAEVQSNIADIERYRIAFNTFRLKYDAIAGDMVNATGIWGNYSAGPPITGISNGDGNGLIEWNTENYYAWRELALAGIISGEYSGYYAGFGVSVIGTQVPPSKTATGCYSVERANQGAGSGNFGFLNAAVNIMRLGAPATNCHGNLLSQLDAYSIDSKLDDGMPFAGKVRLGLTAGQSATCYSVLTTTGTYVVSPSLPASCTMIFVLSQ